MITVNRFDEHNGSTISRIMIDGVEVGYGLEDGYNEIKVMGETRIPSGKYPLKLRTFGGFHGRYTKAKWIPVGVHKGMIEICNVVGFTDVLIHVGNTKKDTRGCLLLGTAYNKYDNGFFVSNSRKAYLKIYPMIADRLSNDEELWIEFIDHININ